MDKNHEIKAEPEIHPEALEQMRSRGGDWVAYVNRAFDSSNCGHRKFLQFGELCTYQEPPRPRLPDTKTEINWPYQYEGKVNLETGEITRD